MDSRINITIANYRCFKEKTPVNFSISKGKTIAFLGKNNTGKSAILRFFYELKVALVNFHSGSWKPLEGVDTHESNPIEPNIHGYGQKYGVEDLIELFPSRDTSKPIRFSFNNMGMTCEFMISRVENTQNFQLTKKITGYSITQNENALMVDIIKQFQDTIYFGSHRNIVNQGAGGNGYYDLSIGSAFIAEWDRKKNGYSVEEAEQAISAEKLIARLIGWDSLTIGSNPEKTKLLLTINNAKRFSLTEMGSGIAELILCIVTAAIRKPSWILIDEPESHLHPDLQVKFVEALSDLCTHGVIFTTHSIGLARTCADDIYVVRQDKENDSYIKSFDSNIHFSQLMGELSFSQYNAVGFETLLLCEGVTEVKTLRQLLRKWNLDSSVLIVPLGGDALIDHRREDELTEFKRLNVNVYVLIDSERETADEPILKRTKFIEKCKAIFGSENAIQTKYRATENYFTQEAINRAMRSAQYQCLTPYQNSKSLKNFWGKNSNWKIAAEMDKLDWLKTDIGEFINQISLNKN